MNVNVNANNICQQHMPTIYAYSTNASNIPAGNTRRRVVAKAIPDGSQCFLTSRIIG